MKRTAVIFLLFVQAAISILISFDLHKSSNLEGGTLEDFVRYASVMVVMGAVYFISGVLLILKKKIGTYLSIFALSLTATLIFYQSLVQFSLRFFLIALLNLGMAFYLLLSSK